MMDGMRLCVTLSTSLRGLPFNNLRESDCRAQISTSSSSSFCSFQMMKQNSKFKKSIFKIFKCFVIIFRPGDLNRLSVDGSLLLAKSAGYTSVFHHQQQQQQQQSSPAFVHPPQHSMSPSSSSSALQQSSPHHGGQLLLQSHHQSHPALVQSMMTCAAVVGKSPSRDLGGGSTPVLKTTTAAHHTPATAQVKNKISFSLSLSTMYSTTLNLSRSQRDREKYSSPHVASSRK